MLRRGGAVRRDAGAGAGLRHAAAPGPQVPGGGGQQRPVPSAGASRVARLGALAGPAPRAVPGPAPLRADDLQEGLRRVRLAGVRAARPSGRRRRAGGPADRAGDGDGPQRAVGPGRTGHARCAARRDAVEDAGMARGQPERPGGDVQRHERRPERVRQGRGLPQAAAGNGVLPAHPGDAPHLLGVLARPGGQGAARQAGLPCSGPACRPVVHRVRAARLHRSPVPPAAGRQRPAARGAAQASSGTRAATLPDKL